MKDSRIEELGDATDLQNFNVKGDTVVSALACAIWSPAVTSVSREIRYKAESVLYEPTRDTIRAVFNQLLDTFRECLELHE